jgi:hypothetical protein
VREARVSISRFRLLLLPLLALFMAATRDEEGTPGKSDSDDLEHNRRVLQKWKTDPEHFARLKQDLRDFWALPEAKRQQLRRLDGDFHQLDAKTQKRLWQVAEGYEAWLERLPENERRQIEETKDTQERLQLIRTIRERQWVERLPQKVRGDLEKLPAAERSAKVVVLRKQEQQQRKLWSRPLSPEQRTPQPMRTADLPPETKRFINNHLWPHLTAEEKKKYNQAEGHPEFARTVKELAKRHPVLLPLHNKPIVRFDELPEKAKVVAGPKPNWERRVEVWERLRRVEGKWPEWALTFLSLLTEQQRKDMPPLGASRPMEFSQSLRDFLKNTLSPKASAQEMKQLNNRRGKWPDYPLHLLYLAEKYKLELPAMSLPGAADW